MFTYVFIWLFSFFIYNSNWYIYIIYIYTMDTNNLKLRLEMAESWLKKRLWEFRSTMPIQNGASQQVSILDIYAEWMDYLTKNGEKWLVVKRKQFLKERNTDAIADLIIWFFEAKRRYGRDQERWEYRWWHQLCSNYCEKWWWRWDEALLHSFFSSYSAAEKRIRAKVKRWEILVSPRLSLLEMLDIACEKETNKIIELRETTITKIKKIQEEQEKRKIRLQSTNNPKLRNTIQHKIQEQNISLENNLKLLKKIEKELAKKWTTKEIPTNHIHSHKGTENHYGWNDRDIINDEGDIILNPSQESIEVSSDHSIHPDELLITSHNSKKESQQLNIPFEFDE